MEQTPITPTLLKEKGFVEDFRNGYLMFVNGKYAITYFYAWIPLNINDLGVTVMSNVYVNTWEEFERLCSNSNFSKQQIITQALKDFMKEYKHLL